MAKSELIVDDDYCKKMGEYFYQQGQILDQYFDSYISILRGVQNSAITSGDTSKALAAYILQAEKMKNKIVPLSAKAKVYAENYISQIDAADKYLF